jgi:hypothetical protein
VGSKGRAVSCPTEVDFHPISNGGLHESQLGCSEAVRTGLRGGFNLLKTNGIDLDGFSGKARQVRLWSEKTDHHQHRYGDEKKAIMSLQLLKDPGKAEGPVRVNRESNKMAEKEKSLVRRLVRLWE